MACRSSKSGITGRSQACRRFKLLPSITRSQTGISLVDRQRIRKSGPWRPDGQLHATTLAKHNDLPAGAAPQSGPADAEGDRRLLVLLLSSRRHGVSVTADAIVQAGRPLLRSASSSLIPHPSSFRVRPSVPRSPVPGNAAYPAVRRPALRSDYSTVSSSALGDCSSHDQLRQHRPRRDRWPAADGVILRRRDSLIFDPQVKDHERTAARRAGMARQSGFSITPPLRGPSRARLTFQSICP